MALGLGGKPLGACTRLRAARDQGWGTFSRPWPGPPFTSSEAKERRGGCFAPGSTQRCRPYCTQRGAGRCFLRPFPRQPWAGSCPPHRCECSLAVPAALATSSCQTAASRAASGPGPVSSPSARVLLPARGPEDTLGAGRQETVAACPRRGPPSPATAGGAGRGR